MLRRADTWQELDCPCCKQSIQVRVTVPERVEEAAQLFICAGANKLAYYNPLIHKLNHNLRVCRDEEISV